MLYLNQDYDPISTVQLSPFVEEQWHRIDTYSPVCNDWADTSMSTPRRTYRPASGKLNAIEQIDLNTLKLDDEILLNELHDIRRGSALLAKAKHVIQEFQVVGDGEREKSATPAVDDRQTPASDVHQPKVPLRQTLAEPSFASRQPQSNRPLSSKKTVPFQLNTVDQTRKFPQITFGPKSQPSLAVQLRQSAIIRQSVLLANNDQRLPTPKRSVSSANSIRPYQHQPELSLRHELNSGSNNDDRSSDAASPLPRRARARSAYSSRSTMHLLKARNDRMRQKHNVELKCVLIKPWRQAPWNEEVFDNSIPNSLDMMHQLCGPSTPFERILRHDYRKQLDLYRSSSIK